VRPSSGPVAALPNSPAPANRGLSLCSSRYFFQVVAKGFGARNVAVDVALCDAGILGSVRCELFWASGPPLLNIGTSCPTIRMHRLPDFLPALDRSCTLRWELDDLGGHGQDPAARSWGCLSWNSRICRCMSACGGSGLGISRPPCAAAARCG